MKNGMVEVSSEITRRGGRTLLAMARASTPGAVVARLHHLIMNIST
jgi:multisubunit Na+/H+ antiporter MnhE subunit